MSKGKMSFNFKEITIVIILFVIFLSIGIISVKGYTQCGNKRNTVYIKETLNFIEENNPINISLNEKIKSHDEKQRLEREIARKVAEEEEKRAEQKRIKQEEIKKREEEKAAEEKKKKTSKSSKIAYLTFDDGPSETITREILKILDDYEIKATFFVLGKMVKEYPETLKLIYESGHSIGNHSYSHNYKFIYKNTDNFLIDIEKADLAFKAVLGDEFETNLLRLPGGSFESYKKKYVKAAEEKGYINYDWHALNGDAEIPKKDKSQLVKRLKDTIKGRKELVVLMHDTDTKINTVKALPEIIEHLISEGYTFKALEQ